jgi:hypothetical protein
MTTETALVIFVAISMAINIVLFIWVIMVNSYITQQGKLNKTVGEVLDDHKKSIKIIAEYIKETV